MKKAERYSMEYLKTTSITRQEKPTIEIDIFQVDTESYFAHPKNTNEVPEFYFGKTGRYWHTEPSVYVIYLMSVVEELGFEFTNRFPLAPGENADLMVRYAEPRKTT